MAHFMPFAGDLQVCGGGEGKDDLPRIFVGREVRSACSVIPKRQVTSHIS